MRILVAHEVEFIEKVVFEWQEFPEMLARLGHQVSILDYDSQSGWEDVRKWGAGPRFTRAQYRLNPQEHVDLYRMIGPPPAVLRRTYAALMSFRSARKLIQNVRPDVVLLYAVPTCGLAILSAAHSAGVPVVFRSIDTLSQLVPRALSFGVHAIERVVYSRCDKVLVANPVLETYIADMSRGRATTELLLSPVDSQRFRFRSEGREQTRKTYGIPKAAPVVVFVGSLFHFVGLDDVLGRWEHIAAAVPDARLLIVGGGPDEARLRAIASRSPACASIVFTGMRPYDEIPLLISAGDVGICPFELVPVARNANPIKIMQYLACGLPCISTPLDGTTAVLPDTLAGVVYEPPGESFARRTVRLLQNVDERVALGDAGRTWAACHHSFETLASQLSESLESAVLLQ